MCCAAGHETAGRRVAPFVHDTLLRVIEKRNAANDSMTLYGYNGLGQLTTVHKDSSTRP